MPTGKPQLKNILRKKLSNRHGLELGIPSPFPPFPTGPKRRTSIKRKLRKPIKLNLKKLRRKPHNSSHI